MILPAETQLQRRSLITLTTDFGLSDHYVGTMKGVIVSRLPGVTLVDVTHQVKPFSLFEGAYAIAQAAPYFPAGTVHLVVIDPGVGTDRKAVVVEANDQMFVAPDNGVLSLVLEGRAYKAHQIEQHNLLGMPVSSTFHGRDIFAPVAASLASGAIRPDEVGRPLEQLLQLPGLQEREVRSNTFLGRVLSVDHFGNVITNFRASRHDDLSGRPFRLETEHGEVTVFRRTFAEAPPATCFAYFGSSGFVEIGMDRASAAGQLGTEPGSNVGLTYL